MNWRGGVVSVVALACAAMSWVVASPVTAVEPGKVYERRGGTITPDRVSVVGASLAVSASGNRMVVGAPTVTNATGAVVTYNWEPVSKTWGIAPTADLNGPIRDSEFGTSVALSADGTTLAVGAPGSAGAAPFVGVYRWDDQMQEWGSPVTVTRWFTERFTRFGASVALSDDGTTLAVGAPHAPDSQTSTDDTSHHGAVIVYQLSDIDGQLTSSMYGTPIIGPKGSETGSSVTFSARGTRLAVAAAGHDIDPIVDPSSDEGSVTVYTFDQGASDWVAVGDPIIGSNYGDRLGTSVALSASGAHLVVGAPGADAPDANNPKTPLVDAGQVQVLSDIDGVWATVGDPVYGWAGDELGSSVAIADDGARFVSGSPLTDISDMTESSDMTDLTDAGRVVIYDKVNSAWVSHGEGSLDGTISKELFGAKLELSGDGTRLMATAPGTHQVQSFTITANTLNPHPPLAVTFDEGASVGQKVKLSGDGSRMVIGATSASKPGLVRTLEWDSARRSWVASAADLVGTPGSRFGRSVALSADGDTLAVGAAYTNDEAGQALVYRWDGDTHSWGDPQHTIDGLDTGDQFGFLVALSDDGDTLAVSAPYAEDSPANNGSGETTIYRYHNDAWTQIGQVLRGQPDSQSGTSVALSADGNRIAIGAPSHHAEANGGFHAGAATVFDFVQGSSEWVQVGDPIVGQQASTRFGESVALSADGNRIAIGAFTHDGPNPNNPATTLRDSGMVQVFDHHDGTWTPAGEPIYGNQTAAFLGLSVDLTADGTGLVAGSYWWDAPGRRNAGRVVIAHWDGSRWELTQAPLEGLTEESLFGNSVALSSTGDWLAASGAGHARAFELTEPPGPHDFDDVPTTGWRNDAVAWLKHHEITTGCSPDQFCPEYQMTRAQEVTFLWRFVGQPAATTRNPFTDVARDRYYTAAIDWAAEVGIAEGYAGTGRFGPEDRVTRGQAVTFLWRHAGQPEPKAAHGFVDVPDGRYFTKAVAWAKQQGITTGTSPTTFSPDRPVTRAEFAAIFQRYATQ